MDKSFLFCAMILQLIFALVSFVSSTVAEVSAQNITLLWDAPTINADTTPIADLAYYKVKRSLTSGNYLEALVTNVSAPITQLTPTDLQNNIRYYFVVTAVDTSGNESTISNEISILTPAANSNLRLLSDLNGDGLTDLVKFSGKRFRIQYAEANRIQGMRILNGSISLGTIRGTADAQNIGKSQIIVTRPGDSSYLWSALNPETNVEQAIGSFGSLTDTPLGGCSQHGKFVPAVVLGTKRGVQLSLGDIKSTITFGGSKIIQVQCVEGNNKVGFLYAMVESNSRIEIRRYKFTGELIARVRSIPTGASSGKLFSLPGVGSQRPVPALAYVRKGKLNIALIDRASGRFKVMALRISTQGIVSVQSGNHGGAYEWFGVTLREKSIAIFKLNTAGIVRVK